MATPRFTPPPSLTGIATRLEEAGYQAWAVGGALRDAWLERGERTEPEDWDLATDARPEEVQASFRRTVPIGIEHGTVGVLSRDGTLTEVTTFRRDIETDGRHAVVHFADRIEHDLARRDFTINAMAWRPATGEFLDPFGGRRDLEAGQVRAVGESVERFREDFLRVLRGLRFAGTLQRPDGARFQLEADTRAALDEAVAGLDRLSAERVREELFKVLKRRFAHRALDLYAEHGALAHWYPEIDRARLERPESWRLNLAALAHLPPSRPLLRLVRWWIDLGVGAAPDLLERLRFSNDESRTVLHLLQHYRPLVGPMDSAATIRSWLAATGEGSVRDLFRLHFAQARASGEDTMQRYLAAAWRAVHAELLSHPPLELSDLDFSGADALELGVPRGPLIGLLLEELHARVLEDPDLNDRATLRDTARELVRIGGLADRGEADA